jgi:type II secretory pathway pseudopilin PulG
MVKRLRPGYILIALMMAVLVLAAGLMVAVPVWRTEIQREKEEELIFRGRQYVEAVRLFQKKNPGKFPASLEELVEKRFIRKPFKDPMTRDGRWNVVLNYGKQTRSEDKAGQVLVAPVEALEAIPNRSILGVVSPSTEQSFRLYEDQETYNRWLFYYGHDPKQQPKIIYYGRAEEEGKED